MDERAIYAEDLGDDISLEMVLIPSGNFMMGSPEHEIRRGKQEGPQHLVAVSSFFMSRYPVTQTQWRAIAHLEMIGKELNPEPSYFQGEDHPVEEVSWYDAMEFCARLSRATDQEYRLPSEAEWEYACRAGTTTPFSFGETISAQLANYRASTAFGPGPVGEYREKTTEVNRFSANSFGLQDMHGNVLEWCSDNWHDNYIGAPKDGSAWLAHANNRYRVARGGSLDYFPWNCRSAYRNRYEPNILSDIIGFRVCCSSPNN